MVIVGFLLLFLLFFYDINWLLESRTLHLFCSDIDIYCYAAKQFEYFTLNFILYFIFFFVI